MIKYLTNNRLFLIIGLLGLGLTCFGLYEIFNSKRAFESSLFWREHTHEVLSEVEKVKTVVLGNSPSFLVVQQSTFLQPIEETSKVIYETIKKIKYLTRDNPVQGPRLDSLETVARWLVADVRKAKVRTGKDEQTRESSELLDQTNAHFTLLENLVSRIKAEEEKLLIERRIINNKSVDDLAETFFILVACLLVLLVIAFLSIRVTFRNKVKSEAQLVLFESIINSSDDFIVSKDTHGIVLSWNPGAEAIFGYSRKEVVGKHISMLIAANRLKEEDEIAERVRKGNYINRHDTQWKHKNGDIVEVSVTISPIRDPEGTITGACNIGRDITSLKKSESELTYRAQQARDMLDLINDGVIILDKNFCLVYLNKKYADMMHRDTASLTGRCVWEEFPQAVGTPTYEAIRKGMKERIYVVTVDYFEPLDLWHENHVYPTEGGVFVFVRDITEHKRTEEKIRISERIYKSIASSIPGSIICLFDTDLRYTLVEGDMLEKIGYKKESLLGFKAVDVLTPERFAAVLPVLERALAGETFTTEDLRAGYDTISRYVPFKDEHDKVTAVMVVVIDVSELQIAHRQIMTMNTELENKVEERTQQLAYLNKELESFSYSVAHDLRTPLRAVAGYATMLMEDYGTTIDSEGNRLLNLVDKNARKMGVLIDELLTFSKLGRKALVKANVDMKKLIETCIGDLNLDTKTTERIFIHTLSPFVGDASLMKFVINNLLSNAIKYSSKNALARIDISSLIKDNEVIYSIADNGVGFDMAYANKLFGVFQRLHAASEFEGTGVGLAIVQRIVNRHDGKVWANSALGEGATFSFSLPSIESEHKKIAV